MRRFQIFSGGEPIGEGVEWTGGSATGLFDGPALDRIHGEPCGAWFDQPSLAAAERWLREMCSQNGLDEPIVAWLDQEHLPPRQTVHLTFGSDGRAITWAQMTLSVGGESVPVHGPIHLRAFEVGL
jgi:hypothetical protein